MEYPFKDLLPLDEVLEREGYYKDWTHLDPKTFYSIVQISEMIKTKGFGTDVRLLISQLAEHFGLSVAEVVKISNGLIARQSVVENRQDAVEVFNNQVIREMTDKDVISAPEIIQSRTDGSGEVHDTLKGRLDRDSDRVKSIVINALDYGMVADNLTDNTTALQDAIDFAYGLGGGKVLVPAGRYAMFGTVHIKENVVLEGHGKNSYLFFRNMDDPCMIVGKKAEVFNFTISTPDGYTGTALLLDSDHIAEANDRANGLRIVFRDIELCHLL